MVNKTDIEQVINKIITNWNTKCSSNGPKGTSGIIEKGEAPKYELNNGNLTNELLNQIADEMSERWGLEVSLNEKGQREIAMNKFNLWDDKNKTLIRLGKIINHQDWIDFTNGNGNVKENYTLDDVLRYYDELEPLAKQRMGAVLFETNDGASYSRLWNG